MKGWMIYLLAGGALYYLLFMRKGGGPVMSVPTTGLPAPQVGAGLPGYASAMPASSLMPIRPGGPVLAPITTEDIAGGPSLEDIAVAPPVYGRA